MRFVAAAVLFVCFLVSTSVASTQYRRGRTVVASNSEHASARHIMGKSVKFHAIQKMTNSSTDPSEQNTAAGKRATMLTYFGGPVLSNARVVSTLYGSGPYASFITDQSLTNGASMASFFSDIMGSEYIGWQSEYNTPRQTIGRGSFDPVQRTMTPSVASGVVTDDQIGQDVVNNIRSGALPAPTADTVYVIFFPARYSIQLNPTASSCSAFCAFHSTVASGLSPSGYIQYAVMPDLSANGCQNGCGRGSTYQNTCSVTSHEILEAITDPAVGVATSFGPPLAWYDRVTGNENADLCNGQSALYTTASGRTYTVQRSWSNALQSCIVSKGPDTTVPTTTTTTTARPTTTTTTTTTPRPTTTTTTTTTTARPTTTTTTARPTTTTTTTTTARPTTTTTTTTTPRPTTTTTTTTTARPTTTTPRPTTTTTTAPITRPPATTSSSATTVMFTPPPGTTTSRPSTTTTTSRPTTTTTTTTTARPTTTTTTTTTARPTTTTQPPTTTAAPGMSSGKITFHSFPQASGQTQWQSWSPNAWPVTMFQSLDTRQQVAAQVWGSATNSAAGIAPNGSFAVYVLSNSRCMVDVSLRCPTGTLAYLDTQHMRAFCLGGSLPYTEQATLELGFQCQLQQ